MNCFPQVENLLVVVGGVACDGALCDGHCFASIISTSAFSAYYRVIYNFTVMFIMIY